MRKCPKGTANQKTKQKECEAHVARKRVGNIPVNIE